MQSDGTLLVGKSGTKPEALTLRLANRHGLVAGATGTGKTVTLQVLAEGFSNAGVPVFAADIKGDLSGAGRRRANRNRVFVKRAEELRDHVRARPFPHRLLGPCSGRKGTRSAAR